MRADAYTGQDKTHLEFYEEHKISPVSYNLNDIQAHLERRESLYTTLGLGPLAFKSSRVLEVAAGTGHNSLYLAKQLPEQLFLLEPNSTGIKFIKEAYASFEYPHTKPTIVASKLENYSPSQKFDVVLCENWLGCSAHEVSLLQKLSGLLDKNGVLVLTTISPIGFVPNLLRRFLSTYLCSIEDSFEKKTATLIKAFGPHLDTLENMTRTKKDWVQDNMLNPAYFNLCLTVPNILEKLGDNFRIMGSSPSFNEDWRWFKDLCGKDCEWNQHFLSGYWKKAHHFLDYRYQGHVIEEKLNLKLEACANELLQAIRVHEIAYTKSEKLDLPAGEVQVLLNKFISLLPEELTQSKLALEDARQLINKVLEGEKELTPSRFDSLFSRETVYISLARKN